MRGDRPDHLRRRVAGLELAHDRPRMAVLGVVHVGEALVVGVVEQAGDAPQLALRAGEPARSAYASIPASTAWQWRRRDGDSTHSVRRAHASSRETRRDMLGTLAAPARRPRMENSSSKAACR